MNRFTNTRPYTDFSISSPHSDVNNHDRNYYSHNFNDSYDQNQHHYQNNDDHQYVNNEIYIEHDNMPPSYHASQMTETRNKTFNSFKMDREEKYREIIYKHEISNEFADKLQQLQGFKVVFIFDDSGSMNTVLQDSPLNTANNLFKATRWDELQCFANISIEIASLFDPNGCDIYFLNRMPSPIRNVKKPADLVEHFNVKPNGFTPLARVFDTVLADHSPIILNEKKLLIILATDGEPTDDTGKTAVSQFKKCLQSRRPNVFTTIVVCTDDEDSVNYLNRWDRTIPNLDVVDDYRSERMEIKKVKGPNFRFSFGDYVVKSLVGSIDPELDKMDEGNCCLSF